MMILLYYLSVLFRLELLHHSPNVSFVIIRNAKGRFEARDVVPVLPPHNEDQHKILHQSHTVVINDSFFLSTTIQQGLSRWISY